MKFALAMLLLALSAAAAEEELPPGGGNRSLRLGAGVALSSVNTSPFLAGSVAVTPSFTIGRPSLFAPPPHRWTVQRCTLTFGLHADSV